MELLKRKRPDETREKEGRKKKREEESGSKKNLGNVPVFFVLFFSLGSFFFSPCEPGAYTSTTQMAFRQMGGNGREEEEEENKKIGQKWAGPHDTPGERKKNPVLFCSYAMNFVSYLQLVQFKKKEMTVVIILSYSYFIKWLHPIYEKKKKKIRVSYVFTIVRVDKSAQTHFRIRWRKQVRGGMYACRPSLEKMTTIKMSLKKKREKKIMY